MNRFSYHPDAGSTSYLPQFLVVSKVATQLGIGGKSISSVLSYIMALSDRALTTPPGEEVLKLTSESFPARYWQLIKDVLSYLPKWCSSIVSIFFRSLDPYKWYILGVAIVVISGVLTLRMAIPILRIPPLEVNPSVLPSGENNLLNKHPEQQNDFTCVICMENFRQRVYKNCGHFVVCGTCGDQFNNSCPICRTDGGNIQVFL